MLSCMQEADLASSSVTSPESRRTGAGVAGAAALLFALSAAVLIMEILAARLLAPVVGLSLETYTAIIGVVLAGIAAGHALGGILADRYPASWVLGPCVVVGGIGAMLTVPTVGLFGTAPGSDAVGAAVVIAFAGFFLPTASLSAAGPIVTKSRLRQLHSAGHVVGYLSAASTAGALVGTFAAGFVLVGAVPTSRSLYVLGAVTTALGVALVGAGRVARRALHAMVALVVLAGVVAAAPDACDRETKYYCVQVRHSHREPAARVLRLDRLVQGYSDLQRPDRLGFRYQRVIARAIEGARPTGPVRALHVGGGAFAMPRYLAATRAGTTSRVLEIDPALDEVAVAELGLAPGSVEVRNGDGRTLLARERSNAYDVVINDTLGSLDPPWHLTTVETARTIRRLLRPGGVLAVNAVDAGDLRFARAETATLREVFDFVAVVRPPASLRETPANIVLVASNSPLRLRVNPDDGEVLSSAATESFAAGATVLVDDFAPIEKLAARGRS